MRLLLTAILLSACGAEPVIQPVEGSTCAVPTEPSSLFAWLRDGGYEGFASESTIHDSATRIHAGRVRVFANTTVGSGPQPQCAALVKELYDGDALSGYAVAVKYKADSDAGRGWYWYETFDVTHGAPSTSAPGAPVCVGCHKDGQDFVWSPLPLR